MKKLSDYCVYVANPNERTLALKFFRLASHRPLNPYSSITGNFVGMGGKGSTNQYYKGSKPTVSCGTTYYNTETVIKFSDMGILADTKSRQVAFDKVFS